MKTMKSHNLGFMDIRTDVQNVWNWYGTVRTYLRRYEQEESKQNSRISQENPGNNSPSFSVVPYY